MFAVARKLFMVKIQMSTFFLLSKSNCMTGREIFVNATTIDEIFFGAWMVGEMVVGETAVGVMVVSAMTFVATKGSRGRSWTNRTRRVREICWSPPMLVCNFWSLVSILLFEVGNCWLQDIRRYANSFMVSFLMLVANIYLKSGRKLMRHRDFSPDAKC